MALRVLLADESATIKRVIQLALQDFGVEVKSVPVGTDVLHVARSFHPDIVFADVLLSKRSGYEVSSELKTSEDLKNIPVVLMWSGFMELDQARVLSSRADRQIEKPFDPEQLRTVVKELVPHLRTNSISQFLSFPDRPEFVDEEHTESQELVEEQMETIPKAETPEEWTPGMTGADEEEEFRHVPLPRNKDTNKLFPASEREEEWSQQDLSRFRVGPEGANDEIALPEIDEEVADSNFMWSSTGEEAPIHSLNPAEETSLRRKQTPATPAAKPSVKKQEPQPALSENDAALAVPALDFERAEQILREQAREVLEAVAWRILPDIAERIVREELQKLMKDSERLEEI